MQAGVYHPRYILAKDSSSKRVKKTPTMLHHNPYHSHHHQYHRHHHHHHLQPRTDPMPGERKVTQLVDGRSWWAGVARQGTSHTPSDLPIPHHRSLPTHPPVPKCPPFY
ncbi:hypothetical protein E2C01_027176 [Portunus trituberculatus]|uniref:Uncharacterized protein n=1 Tax=Portunus trituberculatus TaxID=210409 RepID=A0A5B7EHH4_PORTR|nr:hypothetical protein [Portunus trituberculatus]